MSSASDGREHPPDVFECGVCGNVTFGDRPAECCGDPMARAGADGAAAAGPDLDELLTEVFDMSTTELDVCLCVMESPEATVSEIAEQLGVDRSLVSRHLNHLAALGVVEKTRRLQRSGGHVHVYVPVDEATVRRRLRTALYRWVQGALATLDALSREKVEAVAEVTDRSTDARIYE